MNFGALSRGFGTCCLRFKNDVATIPARLTSGWLARLCREGVDPLDRCKRFQVIHPPFLDLAWRKGSFMRSLLAIKGRRLKRLTARNGRAVFSSAPERSRMLRSPSALSFDHLVGGGEQPGGNSVDLSAPGHCRLAHANEFQMPGHARFPRIRVLWMVGAVVNDNVLEIEGA